MAQDFNGSEKEQLVESISQLTAALWPRITKKFLKPLKDMNRGGLTVPHLHILHFLEKNGATSMTDLAERMGLLKPNLTCMADKLYGLGYVERIPNKNDRRVVNISLTDTGKAYLLAQRRLMSKILYTQLNSTDPEDLKRLKEGLSIINEVMNKV